MEHYIERDTTVATKRVQDAETAIEQKHKDMRSAESGGLTSREHSQTYEEMWDAI